MYNVIINAQTAKLEGCFTQGQAGIQVFWSLVFI